MRFRRALWPDRSEWTRSAPSHHEIHFSMDYDAKNRKLVVFGDYKGRSKVWTYTPARAPGQIGRWEKMEPTGDDCPDGEHYPVAYDTKNGGHLGMGTTDRGVCC